MIFCVETLGMRPAVATGIGATLGGITNFTLGRIWVFPGHAGRLYALKAGGESELYQRIIDQTVLWYRRKGESSHL